MKKGECYARVCKEPALKVCGEPGKDDILVAFIVNNVISKGCYEVINVNGDLVNTSNLSFDESEFSEISAKDFLSEYTIRLLKRVESHLGNCLLKQFHENSVDIDKVLSSAFNQQLPKENKSEGE